MSRDSHEPAGKDSGTTDRPDPIQTVMRAEPVDGGAWHAYEPAADGDLKGRGATPPEAIANYCHVIGAREGDSDE